MTTRNKALGNLGEDIAVEHLLEAGMQVLERNWFCRHGELDVIALDASGCLVFCEVKTRSSARFGTAVEAVTPAKAARLRRLACLWLDAHRRGLPELRAVRIDVVAVTLRPAGEPEVVRLEGVA